MNSFFSKFGKYVIIGFARLPLAILYLYSNVLYFLMFYIVRYRRKVVRVNLNQSFSEKPEHEIKVIEKKFYRHFGDLMIESLKNAGSSRQVPNRIQYKNADFLHKLHDEGRSIILYAAHYGNWEWLSVLPLTFKFRMIAFYQPLSNVVFDALIKRSRERYGITAVPSSQAYKALKTYNDNGEHTLSLVLGDQSPPPDGAMVWLPFLNRETAFIVGAGKIAKKLGHIAVYPHFRKLSRGHYEVEFIILKADENPGNENPYVKSYAAQLEKSIQSEPSMWLWSHRRWKLNPESS